MKAGDFNPNESDVDPNLIANIACKKAAQELKDTIIIQKESENLNKQYKVLLTTDKGFINDHMSQDEILETLDVSSKTKKWDIPLKYGPYSLDFSRDGIYMCAGGVKGELAMLDWKSKDLKFDINVKEKIRAVKYLHRETQIAVSQLDYTYIYDNEGKELHCIRQLFRADHLEYLPYHSLLVAGTEKGFIHYLDVTTGNIVSNIKTFHGPVKIMCQNKDNAIICTGHSKGTVTMWSPNEASPVMKMLCHDTALHSATISNDGNFLVTAGLDRKMKVWDLRSTNEQLCDLRLGGSPSSMQFSQQGLLAVAMGGSVHVLKDIQMYCDSLTFTNSSTSSLSLGDMLNSTSHKVQPVRNIQPLLSHSFYGSTVHAIQFCPFEDILGCGLSTGMSTMFVPGSGEPNFDAFESNPYASVNFRKEQQVKQLLEKIPSEFISLTASLGKVYKRSIAEEWDAEKSKLYDTKPVIAVKKKRSKKTKPRPATMKKITTKDNLHFERLKLQKDLHKAENVTYRVKKPLSKQPINSVLDNLIYKRL